jgi:23S rRNA pseudouridine1911/1915/1917 synthase
MNEELIILHEDNHIIVVLKEQNIPSCEDESKDKDLLTMIKEYIKVKYNKPGNVYVGLVHRLDRPTGGVMVFAKTSKAAARLSEQMKTGDFEKKYFAVLVGLLREKKNTLVHYMKKNPVNNMVYVCAQTTDGAKMASLEYRMVEEYKNYTLAEIKLHTGRSHQIRVQMNAIGNPVFGDMRYGGEKAQKGYLALWAYELSFTHPVTKERMVFKIEPPKDLTPWKAFNIDRAVAIIK